MHYKWARFSTLNWSFLLYPLWLSDSKHEKDCLSLRNQKAFCVQTFINNQVLSCLAKWDIGTIDKSKYLITIVCCWISGTWWILGEIDTLPMCLWHYLWVYKCLSLYYILWLRGDRDFSSGTVHIDTKGHAYRVCNAALSCCSITWCWLTLWHLHYSFIAIISLDVSLHISNIF